MANTCLYKVKVVGEEIACKKLMEIMPCYDGEIEVFAEERGEQYMIGFEGTCKWSVDSYTSSDNNRKPLTKEEIANIGYGDFGEVPLSEKALMLGVEIFCNSKDIDSSCAAEYVHYDSNGKYIFDECPQILHIKRGRDYDFDYNPEDKKKAVKVRFQDGRAYWYLGDFEENDLVYVIGARENHIGKVTETKITNNYGSLYNVAKKVGHIENFIMDDIVEIWSSYKPKDRKEYLKRNGFDEKCTKNKFLTIVESMWTEFAMKENNWDKFLETLKN